MTTTYEYTYEYEVANPSKQTRNTGGNTQRSVGQPYVGRSDGVDSLQSIQHDRIWNKLYDPSGFDKAQHDVEVQRTARRQDRKITKIEAAYGSDRQTFIVKRDYDLCVRDVRDEASKVFKIPPEQVILYWKGRNICETPDMPLETLGVENNNTMRIARADDQYLQRNRQGQYQQGSSSGSSGYQGSGGASYSGGYSAQQQQYGSGGGMYGQQGSSSSSGAMYGQQSGAGGYYGQASGAGGSYGQSGSSSNGSYGQSYTNYPSQTYYSGGGGYDQQYMSGGGAGNNCNCMCHQDQPHSCKCCGHCHGPTNHYQQFTNRTLATPIPAAVAATYIITLQIGIGDHVQGLAIGRQHPITIYDLQVELQQRYNIPLSEQHISYNGMPLSHLPPDTSLETIGILNNAFIAVWQKNSMYIDQQQSSGRFTPRQQATGSSLSSSYYESGSQSLYGGDMSSRRMYYSNSGDEQVQSDQSQEAMELEVFHGPERHVLVLRSVSDIRIGDLMEELQNITAVPVQKQRLYYRGQALQSMKERSLREMGLDNNAQLRLIGEPTRSRYA